MLLNKFSLKVENINTTTDLSFLLFCTARRTFTCYNLRIIDRLAMLSLPILCTILRLCNMSPINCIPYFLTGLCVLIFLCRMPSNLLIIFVTCVLFEELHQAMWFHLGNGSLYRRLRHHPRFLFLWTD